MSFNNHVNLCSELDINKNDKINKTSNKISILLYKSPPMALKPLVGQGLLIIEASRSLRHTTFENSFDV
jgi:hypothetical protein